MLIYTAHSLLEGIKTAQRAPLSDGAAKGAPSCSCSSAQCREEPGPAGHGTASPEPGPRAPSRLQSRGLAGGDSAELTLKIDQTLRCGAILLEQHKLSGCDTSESTRGSSPR